MSHLSDELQEQYEDFRMLARKATKETLDQPDWPTNTECVNIVKTVTDPDFLHEITQLLMRRLREPCIRVVVLTLYLIDALAHNCGHALLLAFNDENFMQQVASVARKYHLSPAQLARSVPEDQESRLEAVSVCLELLHNWAEFFCSRRAYYSNMVDMYEILESEGIGKPGTPPLQQEPPQQQYQQQYQPQQTVLTSAEPKRLQTHHSRRSLHSSDVSLATNDRTNTTTDRTHTTGNTRNLSSRGKGSGGAASGGGDGSTSGRTSHSNSNNNNISNMLLASSYSTDAYDYSPRTVNSVLPSVATSHNNHPTNTTNTTNTRSTRPNDTTTSNGLSIDTNLRNSTNVNSGTTNTSNPTGSPSATHPWLSREDRGMQSKSDYSKTTLDSHELHYKRSGSDSVINIGSMSPDMAESKRKNSVNSTEHKSSKANMGDMLYGTSNSTKPAHSTHSKHSTNTTNTTNPIANVLSPPHTTYAAYPKASKLNDSNNTDEDFGIVGDAFDDFGCDDMLSPTQYAINNVGSGGNSSNKYAINAHKHMYDTMEAPVSSPGKPAQRALHEFLTTNTIDDAQLQEELLNQVEIEKRIQEINRSKSVDTRAPPASSAAKGSNVYTSTINSNTYKTSTHTTLQHELQHQREIERSIQEQKHKYTTSTTNYTTTNTTSTAQYTHTKNHTTAPLLNDIRNFQYNSDEHMMYNSGLIDAQHNDNSQVPPRSPHGRYHPSTSNHMSNSNNYNCTNNGNMASSGGAGITNPVQRVRSMGHDTDSEDNYDGHLVDYADGTNMDFFFVPSTNTYIDTEDKKRKEYANGGSSSSSAGFGASGGYGTGTGNGGGNGNMYATSPVHNVNMHNVPNAMSNTMPNAIPALPNMYGPAEFVSLTTTHYNFAKIPSFYSGMNMNVPMNNMAITNGGSVNNVSNTYYNNVNGTSHTNTRTTNTNANTNSNKNTTTANSARNALLNTNSNNSLLLDQQIEQQKLILQEFERQKALQMAQDAMNASHANTYTYNNNTYNTTNASNNNANKTTTNSNKNTNNSTTNKSNATTTHTTNNNDIDHLQEVNIAKERLLRQQANMLSSGASSSGASAGNGGNGGDRAVQYNNNTGTFYPPAPSLPPTPLLHQHSNNSSSNAQRPRGVENLTLRTNNNNNAIDAGSLYGSSVGGASGGGYSSGGGNRYTGNSNVGSVGGVNRHAVNRAAAGTPLSVHTGSSSPHHSYTTPNSAALRREKERLAARKAQLESEWAAEQLQAIESANSMEFAKFSSGGDVGTRVNVYGGSGVGSEQPKPERKFSTLTNNTGNKVISSSSGKKYTVNVAEYFLDDNDTHVSDLTCSSAGSTKHTLYTNIENETVAAPLTRADSFTMQTQYVDTGSAVLPAKHRRDSGSKTSNTNSNVATGNTLTNIITTDPVLQATQLLREALDPNNTNTLTSSTGATINSSIDRDKALAAAQLLIATLTGTPAPTPIHANTHTKNTTNANYNSNSNSNVGYDVNRSITQSSSNDGSRLYGGSLDVSEIAIARTPTQRTNTAYPNTSTNTSNTATVNAAPTHSIHNTLQSANSIGMPPRSPMGPNRTASNGNLTALTNTSAAVSATSSKNSEKERYLVPDVVSKTQRNNATAEISSYPESNAPPNTVALQSGISVITDSSYYSDSVQHKPTNTAERGRSRDRPALSIGIGGIDERTASVDRGSVRGSDRGGDKGGDKGGDRGRSGGDKIHRSASVDATRNTHTTNTASINTYPANNATSADVRTSKVHRSASLDRKRSSGSIERASDRSTSNGSVRLSNGTTSGPPSPLTTLSEHSSPKSNSTGVNGGVHSATVSNREPSHFTYEEQSHANTRHTNNTVTTTSKSSSYDQEANSGANLVANALLNRNSRNSYRGSASAGIARRNSMGEGDCSASTDHTTTTDNANTNAHYAHATTSDRYNVRSHSRSRSPRNTTSTSTSPKNTTTSASNSTNKQDDDLHISRDAADSYAKHTRDRSSSRDRRTNATNNNTTTNTSTSRDVSRSERRSSKERMDRKSSSENNKSPSKRNASRHRDRNSTDPTTDNSNSNSNSAYPDTYHSKYQRDDGYRDANGVDNLGRTREMRKAERQREREARDRVRYDTSKTSGQEGRGDSVSRNDSRRGSALGIGSNIDDVRTSREYGNTTHTAHPTSPHAAPSIPPLALPQPMNIERVGSRDRGESYHSIGNFSTGMYSGVHSTGVHSGYSGLYSGGNTPIERVGSRDSGSRGSGDNNSTGGKVSLVELARSRDPNYRPPLVVPERSRRIYDDERSRGSGTYSHQSHHSNGSGIGAGASPYNNTNTNSSNSPYVNTNTTSNASSPGKYPYPTSYTSSHYNNSNNANTTSQPGNYTRGSTYNGINTSSTDYPILASMSYDTALDHRERSNSIHSEKNRRSSHEPANSNDNYGDRYVSAPISIHSVSTNNMSSRPVPHRGSGRYDNTYTTTTSTNDTNDTSNTGNSSNHSHSNSHNNSYTNSYINSHHNSNYSSYNNSPTKHARNSYTSDDDVTRLSRAVDTSYSRNNSTYSGAGKDSGYTEPHRERERERERGSSTAKNSSTLTNSTSHYASTPTTPHSDANTTTSGGKKWVCSMCTLENPPAFLACDACGMLKSK